jgi:hypothetical protein
VQEKPAAFHPHLYAAIYLISDIASRLVLPGRYADTG